MVAESTSILFQPNSPSQADQREGSPPANGIPIRIVEYYPPPNPVLRDLAINTCNAFAEKFGGCYRDPEVVDGLADFLTVVARIKAKQLTLKIESPGEVK